MKKHFSFILLGIMMLGVVMRAPFTALPAVLTDIASGLGVEVSSLGILTSIPLIMFALCSSIAPRMAAKIWLGTFNGHCTCDYGYWFWIEGVQPPNTFHRYDDDRS